VIVASGTPPFTYSWSPVGGTGMNATNLPAGIYTVTVTDANGCVSVDNTTVIEPPVLTSLISVSTNILCNGGTDGSATVTATGGTGAYAYTWSSGGSGSTENNLAAGNYTVTVTDVNGCQSSSNILITEPSALIALISASGDVLCNGGNDGWATVTASGGTAGYTYLWTPGNGTFATGTNLTAGNYTVTVTDNNGCITTSAAIVGEPTPLVAAASSVAANCFGTADGSASVIAGGGTSPYSYSWSPTGGNGATASNISAGTYTVTITDGNGCEANATANVTEPAAINLSVAGDATICDGQSAIISANASGGISPYSYQWSNGSLLQSQTVQPGTTTVYTCDVTDANGCSASPLTVTVAVNPPLNVLATATPNICAGDNATISASANGGNGGPYTYSWNNGAITGNAATVHPLRDSTFIVTVTDGCSSAAQYIVTIIVNPNPIVDFTPYIINGCTPVTVDFTNNGTTPVGSTYSWSLGDGSSSTDMNPTHTYVTPGHYNVTLNIITPQGCTGSLTVNNDVNVFGLPTAAFNMSADEVTVLSSTVNFTDRSTDAVFWAWDFGDSSGTVMEQNPSHTFSDSGYYNVRLIVMNQAGCVDTIYGVLRVKDDFAIYIPNAFTPNNDGVNDGFIAYGVGWKDYEMWILDRWGLVLYHCTSKDKPWDGTYHENGNPSQNDVYVYKINVHDNDNKLHEFVGHVTLVR
jgi:gliding motility-associated-like protein